jgi:8-oxo-dGTP pyrophosphatase MutT (NUDIX family)
MMDTRCSAKLSAIGDRTTCPAVALVRGGKMLIGLRHYTPDKFKDISLWTVPGGRCDEEETIETALRREAAEETGIANFEIIGYLGDVAGAKAGDIVPVFVGSTDEEPVLKEPEKFSEWRWEDLDDIPANFINPEALSLIRKFAGKI